MPTLLFTQGLDRNDPRQVRPDQIKCTTGCSRKNNIKKIMKPIRLGRKPNIEIEIRKSNTAIKISITLPLC